MKKESSYQKFEITYSKFAGGIFRYIYFRVSDYELARDITSELFVKYWKLLIQEKKIENHKALLYFIAKGLIIDHYRKKNHTKRVSLESVDERLLGLLDTVENSLLQKQKLEEIYAKIKLLKKSYQDMLFLHYVEDLTVKEIAYIQKKKENAIRVLLHRALRSLKECL